MMAGVNQTRLAMMIPPDFKFRPSDEEKIEYLTSKATGSAEEDWKIGTANAYGEKEPWDIFGDHQDTELCFFTPLKKVGNKKPKSSLQRISRNVGQGFWSNKGQRDAVFGRKGGVIGYKRSFRYERKNDDDVENKHGTWLLKEYTLPDNMKGRVKEEYRDYALCVLKRKKESATRIDDDTPDVEIGLDDMLAWIISNHDDRSAHVPVVVSVEEEDWLNGIDWNELADFDRANTWDDGDFNTRMMSQPCSVEENANFFFNHQSTPDTSSCGM